MSRTLNVLREHAARAPEATALSTCEQRIDYRELCAEVDRMATVLRHLCVRTVALLADNSAHWIVADLAAQAAGVVAVPLPTFFSPQQMQHALHDCGADALILGKDMCATSSFCDRHVSAEHALGDELILASLEPPTRPVIMPAATAKISYTSGTTGQPKGVCLSQGALDTVAESLCEVTRDLGLRRHLVLLPLATLLENVAGVYASLQNGGEIAVPGLAEIGWSGAAGIDTRRLFACIHRYAPNSLILVPQMLDALVRAVEDGERVPESLRFAAVGGGHVPSSLLQRADALGLPVYEGYGLTEAASVVTLNTPTARRLGSVGQPLPHVTLQLGTSGDVQISGATSCGYVGSARALTTPLDTGDVGSVDDDGFVHISGRRKNVFITSFGRNVSPEWVEAAFLQAGSLRQIAIFGEARPWNVAVVVPGHGASAEELHADIKRINSTLPDYAQLGDWLAATEPFTPVNGLATANGRNRRTAIWARYRDAINLVYDSYTDVQVATDKETIS